MNSYHGIVHLKQSASLLIETNLQVCYKKKLVNSFPIMQMHFVNIVVKGKLQIIVALIRLYIH